MINHVNDLVIALSHFNFELLCDKVTLKIPAVRFIN